HNIQIVLTPYDIMILRKRLCMGNYEVMCLHIEPFPQDHDVIWCQDNLSIMSAGSKTAHPRMALKLQG
ncbi:MAG: hypothetical protein D3909_13580, partial [Candidatus Electrothrix sp. ATG1]|nr:hypothetical protein [Candidatus Electrothrix sp. ATG1]